MPANYRPQPVARLKARFHRIWERVFDLEMMLVGIEQTPSEFPEHVFDFDDGLRLVVSIEKDILDRRELHVMADIMINTKLWYRVSARKIAPTDLQALCEERIKQIVDRELNLEFSGANRSGKLHWTSKPKEDAGHESTATPDQVHHVHFR